MNRKMLTKCIDWMDRRRLAAGGMQHTGFNIFYRTHETIYSDDHSAASCHGNGFPTACTAGRASHWRAPGGVYFYRQWREIYSTRGELCFCAAGRQLHQSLTAGWRLRPPAHSEDFARLAGLGYNTVRVFLDQCSRGPDCIARTDEAGLNSRLSGQYR